MKADRAAVTVLVIHLFFFQVQVVLDTDMCDLIPNFWKILIGTLGIKYLSTPCASQYGQLYSLT